MPPILSSLPPNERTALATCGILNDEQLAKVNVDTLLRDLQMAKEAFPEANFNLSETKLRSLCAQAIKATTEPKEALSPTEQGASAQESGDDTHTDPLPLPEEEPPRALPELALRRHQHRRNRNTPVSLTEAPGVSSSVHCSRPVTTYLAALSMLAFYIGIFSLLLLPFSVFAGYLDSVYLYPSTFVCMALLVPYMFIGLWCHCSVCKMNFFRLVPYNLNRHAHSIPFLGLTTLVTALHIIFFRWYRCPACGTAIRLFRSRHSRH